MALTQQELQALAQPNGVYDQTLATYSASSLEDVIVNEQSVRRLARGESRGTIVEQKDNTRRLEVPIALSPLTWNQPLTPYNAAYPYNRVMQTRNGHVQEFDDTPGNQRYHRYHPSGTFIECDSEGNEVRKIIGDRYTIIEKNGHVFIAGQCDITVEGSCNIRVMNNCNLEVDGSLNATVKNDINMVTSGCFNLNVKETFKIRADNMVVETSRFNHKNIGVYNMETQTLDCNVKGQHVINNESFALKTNQKAVFNTGSEYQIDASKVAVKTDLHLLNNLYVQQETHSQRFRGIAQYAEYAQTAGQAPEGSASPTSSSRTEPAVNIQEQPLIQSVLSTGLLIPDERAAVRTVSITPSISNTRTTRLAIENDDLPPTDALYPGYGQLPYVPQEAVVTEGDPDQSGGRVPQVQPGSVSRIAVVPTRTENLITTTDPSTFISRYFTLADVSTRAGFPHTIRQQLGLEAIDIAKNLQFLATNVLDKIVDQYGRQSFIITSGFRPANVRGVSQHNKGEAIDIQFKNIDVSFYPNRANELIRLIPFDQLLLEYQSGGSGKPWIHISLTQQPRYQFATFYDHRVVSPPGFIAV